MRDAFFSFGYVNQDIVESIAEAVEATGLTVFSSKWDLAGGDHIWAEINAAIDDCKRLVLFLSSEALNGPGIKKEIHLMLQKAYEEVRKRDGWTIIPVMLTPFKDLSAALPVEFRSRSFLTFADPHVSFVDHIASLVQAIERKPTRRTGSAATQTDFYYRLTQHDRSLLYLEIASGLPEGSELGVVTRWSDAVEGDSWVRTDKPNKGQSLAQAGGMSTFGSPLSGHQWPGPAPYLVRHESWIKVSPSSSLYLRYSYEGAVPSLDQVGLLDPHGGVLRDQLCEVASGVP